MSGGKRSRSMSRHDPKVTLRQIADFARQTQAICAGMTLPALLADWQALLAFGRAMEILGEAVKRFNAGGQRLCSSG